MNNKLKYEYVKQHWELRNGVVYSRRTDKKIKFSGIDSGGRHFQMIRVNDKQYNVREYEAVFVLFHDRPIAEGKEIHHRDGNHLNNAPENLIELTRTQHQRIHKYQIDDPLRGICLNKGGWQFRWLNDNGRLINRRFNEINDAMTFRAEIEEPRRQELRALGLNCKKEYRGITASQLRRISRQQNTRLWRAHI
ncbi:HNH endonuclease [Escherichia coli O9,9a:H30]